MHPWARPAHGRPLDELWDRRGTILRARPRRWLAARHIAELMRTSAVTFVVVNVGEALRWVSRREVPEFWVGEVAPRVVDPAREEFSIEDYPGGRCYRAQEWREGAGGEVFVVLYHFH